MSEKPNQETGFIYFVSLIQEMPGKMDDVVYIKIGFTKDVKARLAVLKSSQPFSMSLVAAFPGTKADEARIHKRFAHLRVRREWFRDDMEIDDLIDDLADYQRDNCDPGSDAEPWPEVGDVIISEALNESLQHHQ